ncbi:hypothetical protein [Halococcus saccharolyticus]|uniref:hypothetical protein n=1 Tax=Halococcus saccharolyticus TaxID=62319 RepID=UPI0006779E39|nr:hypothetical protein [Halococcus saccharolyticus]
MAFDYEPIEYEELSGTQKENYNYQKICAVLADYGFSTIRLTDDWKGADFIAQRARTAMFSSEFSSRDGSPLQRSTRKKISTSLFRREGIGT